MSLDEWGLGPPWKVKKFATAHAMFGAATLSVAMANSHAADLRFTNYFEPVNEGAIEVHPPATRLSVPTTCSSL